MGGRQVWPLGAPVSGGTAITLIGDGFVSFDSAAAAAAVCRFLPVGSSPAACERYEPSLLRLLPRRSCVSRAYPLPQVGVALSVWCSDGSPSSP